MQTFGIASTQAQAGQVQQYLSRWNSQQFYDEADVFDPIAPFPPLPSMITPPPRLVRVRHLVTPPMRWSGRAIVGGINTGLSTYNSLKGIGSSGGGGGGGGGDKGGEG